MLNFFRRRHRRSNRLDAGSLAIGDLLEQPALAAVMRPIDDEAPIPIEWSRLMASGPIRFDQPAGAGRHRGRHLENAA